MAKESLPNSNPKICTKCGSEKVQVKDAAQKLGYAWRCKPCQAVYRRAHYQQNITSYREYNRESHQAHLDRNKAINRKNYLKNAEVRKAKAREWAKQNPDRRKEIDLKHRRANPDTVREAKRKWASSNPDYMRAKCVERRARKAGVVNTLTLAEWKEIQQRFGYRCAYCGEEKKLSMDHVTPISKGGSHTANNVVPACISCNSRKQAGAPLVPVQPLLIA